MKRDSAKVFLSLTLSALLCTACGDDATDPSAPDASMDAMPEAGQDATLDAMPDAMPDATPDAMPDAAADAMPDATPDAMPDATPDASVMTGGMATSMEITAVRAADDGMLMPGLPITDTAVTYVRPMIGSDPAGFFIQAEMAGPALFVAIDPTTLSPAPTPGDVVSFTVDAVATSRGQKRVTMLSGFSRTTTGFDVTSLTQDISGIDPVAMVNDLDSEMITITGSLVGTDSGCGTPHRCIQISTAGYMMPTNDLRVRIPAMVLEDSGATDGCTVTVGPTPLWRFNDSVQPSAWQTSEMTVACPSPMAGEVIINEVAYEFAGSDDNLEWFELYNTSATGAVDLNGCQFTNGTAGTLDVTSSAVIAPGGYAIFAGSMSELRASAIIPATFSLGSDDSLTLTCAGTTVDTVDWSMAGFPTDTDDVSVQFGSESIATPMPAMANDDGMNWCLTDAMTTYGSMSRAGTPGSANATCVMAGPGTMMFTEYVEGSSNNKALEITNRSGIPVNLATSCELIKYTNGGMTGSPISFMGGSTTLMPGDSYTICNPSFSGAAGCDQTSGSINHNGDDAFALECGGVVVDTFGANTGDPGSAWSGGGVTTRDRTLRRLCSVVAGDPDITDAFDPSVQWTEFPRDTFGDLGMYVCP